VGARRPRRGGKGQVEAFSTAIVGKVDQLAALRAARLGGRGLEQFCALDHKPLLHRRCMGSRNRCDLSCGKRLAASLGF